MDLFICAQDIQFVTFGLIQDQTLFFEKTFEVPPEKYLLSLNQFLIEQNKSPEEIKRIMIVNGPGSFTASRVSVSIANTFAFVHGIPMFPIENPGRLSLTSLMALLKKIPEHAFVIPAYDRAPNIT